MCKLLNNKYDILYFLKQFWFHGFKTKQTKQPPQKKKEKKKSQTLRKGLAVSLID